MVSLSDMQHNTVFEKNHHMLDYKIIVADKPDRVERFELSRELIEKFNIKNVSMGMRV